MDIAITKMSSKGQIVIPQEMRKGIKEGEKLVILKDKDRIVMKKASSVEKEFLDDLEFARKTELSWNKYKKGEFKNMNFDEFIEELKKC